MIKRGLSNISMLKVGSASASKAYVGSTLVWSSGSLLYNNLAGKYRTVNGVITIANACPNPGGTMLIDGSPEVASGECRFYDTNMHTVEWVGVTASTPNSTFMNVGSLIEAYFPSGMTSVGNSAFTFCTGLTRADMSNSSISTIGNYAFNGCTSLLEAEVGPAQTIGNAAFSGCSHLTTFKPTSALTTIGNSAFTTCYSLTGSTSQMWDGVLDLRNTSLSTIGKYAFSNTDVSEILLPSTITSIGDYAFAGNSQTNYLELPREANYSIGNYAFSYNSMPGIDFGNGTISLGNNCFEGNGLDAIRFSGTTITSIGDYVFSNNNPSTLVLDVNMMGSHMFSNCHNLSSITIGSRLSAIAPYAFEGTSGSYGVDGYSINLPGTVISIGDSAFQDAQLIEVTLNDGLENIGNNAFNNTKLSAVTIPSSVTYIGNYAFADTRDEKHLQGVRFNCPVPYGLNENIFDGQTNIAVISVPTEYVRAYQSALQSYASIIVGF